MQKFMKRFAVVIMALVATVLMAVFATACEDNKSGNYATDTFTVTVLDENGNAIDGTTFGYAAGDPTWTQVRLQFCNDGGCSSYIKVGADGKATVELEKDGINSLRGNGDIELHIQNLPTEYKVEYSKYNIDKIPLEITVTLEKKA